MVSLADILNARILVVDDLAANVLLLEGMLRIAGYRSVESTTDPREVCELHRKNRYSLILLDLQMPSSRRTLAARSSTTRILAFRISAGLTITLVPVYVA